MTFLDITKINNFLSVLKFVFATDFPAFNLNQHELDYMDVDKYFCINKHSNNHWIWKTISQLNTQPSRKSLMR